MAEFISDNLVIIIGAALILLFIIILLIVKSSKKNRKVTPTRSLEREHLTINQTNTSQPLGDMQKNQILEPIITVTSEEQADDTLKQENKEEN